MTVGRDYARYVRDKTGWWGTYQPNLSMKVGDYLQFTSDDEIDRQGSTDIWPGWKEALARAPERAPGELSYTAHATRNVGAGASAKVPVPGGVPLDAESTVELSFARKSGFVMDLKADAVDRYRDMTDVKRWLINQAKNGKWQLDWVLVTEVMHATSATVVIALEEASSVVLSAAVALPGGFNLAEASLGLQARSSSGSTMVSLCEESTPLFRCVRVRKSWFGRRRAELLGVADEAALAEAFTDDPFEADV